MPLQLVKTQPASGQYAEWGEFLHTPGKRFYDFDRIRQASMTDWHALLRCISCAMRFDTLACNCDFDRFHQARFAVIH